MTPTSSEFKATLTDKGAELGSVARLNKVTSLLAGPSVKDAVELPVTAPETAGALPAPAVKFLAKFATDVKSMLCVRYD